MELAGQPAVVIRNLRSGTATAGVAEKCDVSARLKPNTGVGHDQLSEFHEMVAAATCSELRPCAILHLGRNGGGGPDPLPHLFVGGGSGRPPPPPLRFALARARPPR